MLNAKNGLLLASWLIFALSWVNPPWPGEQVLHSVPAALGLVALWYFGRKEAISVWAFVLVCFFIALHNIGAHWLYSNVPYDAWAQAAFGRTLSPEEAESYNGQQGDIWDAHMDMLLATLGALFWWRWNARRA